MVDEQHPSALDPRIAHQIPGRLLVQLLPGTDQSLHSEVRREFALWLTSPRGRAPVESWQEAWNRWTGATAMTPGRVSVMQPRCPDCRHGMAKRPSPRNASRTGNMMLCGTCRGTGRGGRVTVAARYAQPSASGVDR